MPIRTLKNFDKINAARTSNQSGTQEINKTFENYMNTINKLVEPDYTHKIRKRQGMCLGIYQSRFMCYPNCSR